MNAATASPVAQGVGPVGSRRRPRDRPVEPDLDRLDHAGGRVDELHRPAQHVGDPRGEQPAAAAHQLVLLRSAGARHRLGERRATPAAPPAAPRGSGGSPAAIPEHDSSPQRSRVDILRRSAYGRPHRVEGHGRRGRDVQRVDAGAPSGSGPGGPPRPAPRPRGPGPPRRAAAPPARPPSRGAGQRHRVRPRASARRPAGPAPAARSSDAGHGPGSSANGTRSTCPIETRTLRR